jgi:hypothetical protein
MAAIETEERTPVPEERSRPRLLLAQRIKPQRDRAVVRALLRMLGVAFVESEVIAPVEAPVDVRFREAQFHLRELCADIPHGGPAFGEFFIGKTTHIAFPGAEASGGAHRSD